MDQISSKDSSHKLQSICGISYFYLYLILYVCFVIFDVIENFEKSLDFECN